MTPGSAALILMMALAAEGDGARVTAASSHLKSKTRVMEWVDGKPVWRAADFRPAAAMDGSDATAWCEGARGPGVGEWLEVELYQRTERLEVTGGFRKLSVGESTGEGDADRLKAWFEQSLSTYRSNGRPAVLEVIDSQREVVERLEMGDRISGRYTFALRLQPGKYRLRIAQIHPGTRFQDACIAELRFPPERASPPNATEGLPSGLLPLGDGPVTCRATGKGSLVPREVRFESHNVRRVMGAEHTDLVVAVRSGSGLLMPLTTVTCMRGADTSEVACLWTGEETGPETLDDASLDAPAFEGTLTTSADAAGRSIWNGEHRTRGGGPLTLSLSFDPAPQEEGRLAILTITPAGGESSSHRYTCSSTR